MAGKFCISLTHSRSDGDKATVGFVVATAALGSGKETMVFMSSDGVWAAVQGEAEKINEGAPFKPLKELLDGFLGAGGKIVACAPCLKKRSIDESQLVDGVEVAGGAVLVEWLSNGSPCVTY